MATTTNEKIDKTISFAQRSPEAIAGLAYIIEKGERQIAAPRPRITTPPPTNPAVAARAAARRAARAAEVAAAQKATTRAAAARSLARKVAVPAELAFNALEAARLVGSPEVRESRVEEAKDLAKKGMMRRAFAAVDNPVGLIYGTGALAKETYETTNDPRIKKQDADYFRWLAQRRAAAAVANAQKAGAQQRSRSEMIRDMARPASQGK